MDIKERDDLLVKLAEIIASEDDSDKPGAAPPRKRARSQTPDVESDTEEDETSGAGDAVAREIQEYLLASEESKAKHLHTSRLAACAYVMESVHDVSSDEENSDSDSEAEDDAKDGARAVSHRLRRYLRATTDDKSARLRDARIAACAYIMDAKQAA